MKKIINYFKRIFGMNYKAMFKTIDKVHKRSGKSKIKIFIDMIKCSIKYQAGYTDYFLFCFEDLTEEQRKTYITRGINNTYIRTLNDREYYKYFRDKVLFNDTFKEYLGREYIDLTRASLDEFKSFLDRNKVIIVKPIDESGGVGIEKIEVKPDLDIEKLYNDLLSTKRTLVEECVVQHEEMAKLCASSVNTLRIVTITKNNKTHIMVRVIRMGNGVNAVDNFHAGGMYTVFDENGVITKPAIDREGNVHDVHPYTKTKIEGFKIPYYKESIELVEQVCKKIPQIRYIGFDIAIGKNGPVIIEGNELPGYDLYQSKIHLSENKEGLKPLFDKVIYEDENE